MTAASAETAPNPAPGFADRPDYSVRIVPTAKRVRAFFGEACVFDTVRAAVVCETGHPALYYIPREDADMSLMTATDHVTWCPFKGHASYFTLASGGREEENALWSYERPFDEFARLAGWLGFYWNRLDSWREEDEEVFVHARDPFVRIDVLESARPVEVVAGGRSRPRTTRARFLFETGHPPRYYIPPEDVSAGVLAPSDHATGCPYKGRAGYRHLKAGGGIVENAAWFYPEPLDEVRRIAGYLCFYPEKVDAILVDGAPV